MGCFSYNCQKCGQPIRDKEGVKLYVLQGGKILEEMQGNYNLYGATYEKEWLKEWDSIVDLHYNRNYDDGIAAIHTDCYKDDNDIPTDISNDDEGQGFGPRQYKQTRTFTHKVHNKKEVIPMKQSIFKKELSAHGKNGTITAEVIATMNYKTIAVKGTHAITHDDYNKNVPIHKVEVLINGVKWSAVDELTNENAVLKASETLIKETQKHLLELANKEPELSFTDKMNQLFS